MNTLVRVAVALSWIISASLAAAQPTGSGESSESAVSAAAPALESVQVALYLGPELDPEKIKAALARELGRPLQLVQPERAALQITSVASYRVRVRYQTKLGDEVIRTVDVPRDAERAADVIALMSVNLSRDQTSELIASLRRNPTAADAASVDGTAEAAAEPEPPPPPPPPPVAPEPKKAPEAKPATISRDPGSELPLEPVPNFSLFYPLASHRDSSNKKFWLEAGFAFSNIGAIEGVAFNHAVLNVRRASRGVLYAGFFNRIQGPLRGVQISPIYAEGRGLLRGGSLGGVLSWQRGPIQGWQVSGAAGVSGSLRGVGVSGVFAKRQAVEGISIAGVASWVSEDVRGLHVGGVFAKAGNVRGISLSGVGHVAADVEGFGIGGVFSAARDVQGATIAGVATWSRDVRGVSFAGVANMSREVNGVAVASLFNYAQRVKGVSFALVNVAGRVDGVQLGLVNVAREVKGTAVGLVSLARNGRVQPLIYTSSEAPLHLGLKFAVGYAYSEFGAGFKPRAGNDQLLLEGGLGARFQPVAGLVLEPGLHYSETYDRGHLSERDHSDLHYRMRVGYRLGDLVEVFAGGGLRHRLYGSDRGSVRAEGFGGVAFF